MGQHQPSAVVQTGPPTAVWLLRCFTLLVQQALQSRDLGSLLPADAFVAAGNQGYCVIVMPSENLILSKLSAELGTPMLNAWYETTPPPACVAPPTVHFAERSRKRRCNTIPPPRSAE